MKGSTIKNAATFFTQTHRFVSENSFSAAQQYATCLQGSGRRSFRAGDGKSCMGGYWEVWYLTCWMGVSDGQSAGRGSVLCV